MLIWRNRSLPPHCCCRSAPSRTAAGAGWMILTATAPSQVSCPASTLCLASLLKLPGIAGEQGTAQSCSERLRLPTREHLCISPVRQQSRVTTTKVETQTNISSSLSFSIFRKQHFKPICDLYFFYFLSPFKLSVCRKITPWKLPGAVTGDKPATRYESVERWRCCCCCCWKLFAAQSWFSCHSLVSVAKQWFHDIDTVGVVRPGFDCIS